MPGIFFGVARTEGSPVVASHSPTLNPPLMPKQRAFHGGPRRLRAWHWMGREEVEYEGSYYWTTPGYGYGVTATSIVPGFRPPFRYKARHLDRMKLICTLAALSRPSNAASSKA